MICIEARGFSSSCSFYFVDIVIIYKLMINDDMFRIYIPITLNDRVIYHGSVISSSHLNHTMFEIPCGVLPSRRQGDDRFGDVPRRWPVCWDGRTVTIDEFRAAFQSHGKRVSKAFHAVFFCTENFIYCVFL